MDTFDEPAYYLDLSNQTTCNNIHAAKNMRDKQEFRIHVKSSANRNGPTTPAIAWLDQATQTLHVRVTLGDKAQCHDRHYPEVLASIDEIGSA